MKRISATFAAITALAPRPCNARAIVTGLSVGAFTAIYALAKDLYDRYATAEVELKFADGSTLKLKGLSYAQAQERMREHLENNLD
jgi:hypothetical protein